MDETQKKYEISLILKSDEAAESVFAHIISLGGEILEKGQPLKIKLSYPIKKETTAFFLTLVINFLPEKISALDHELRLMPDILRFIIITPPVAKEERSERPTHYAKPKPEAPKKQEEIRDVSPNVPAEPEVLTNELLEKKLEEILG